MYVYVLQYWDMYWNMFDIVQWRMLVFISFNIEWQLNTCIYYIDALYNCNRARGFVDEIHTAVYLLTQI